MKKKILIITAYRTGYGHFSISSSVTECLRRNGPVEIREIDGFSLMGRLKERMSGGYGRLVSVSPLLWECVFRVTDLGSGLMDRYVATFSRRRFQALLNDFHPDLIVTVHSMFNRSVSRLLDRCGRRIPLAVIQADIRTLHTTWCNPRADLTVCPTAEAYSESLRQGMPAERLCVIPLPVRKQFAEAAESATGTGYDGTTPPNCLMMLASEGATGMVRYVRNLLDGTGIRLTVICGNNAALRAHLSRLLPDYPGRLEVLGFTKEVARVMGSHDILICRSSPNVLFEGITMNLPIIAMCKLKGQERDNDLLISSNGLGIRSSDYPDLRSAVCALAESGTYEAVRRAQREYRSPRSAEIIADRLLEMAE